VSDITPEGTLKLYSLRDMIFHSSCSAKGKPPFRDSEPAKICRLCERKEDSLFHFTYLTAIWDEKTQNVFYECDDHGGSSGKFLYDCFLGSERWVPRTPPGLYIFFRNLLQSFFLYSYFTAGFIRTCASYIIGWMYLWLLVRVPALLPVFRQWRKRK
jgi:hypothetical protein